LQIRDKQDDATSSSASNNKQKSFILKSIHPPTLTTRNANDESHCRKLLSYHVERNFYHHLSEKLPQPSIITSIDCHVAEYTSLHHDDSSNDPVTKAQDPNKHNLLLSDLTSKFPIQPYHALTYSQTLAVIRWLATFHATFWNPTSQPKSKSKSDGTLPLIPPPLQCQDPDNAIGVWQQGGYWYLDTRRDEYNSMLDNEEENSWLIKYAEQVSEQIKDIKPQWKTLMHGDAKAANILFDRAGRKDNKKKKTTFSSSSEATGSASSQGTKEEEKINSAMYDFQYVGMGLGVQDLVYFLGTSVESRVLAENMSNHHYEDGQDDSSTITFLKYYHEHLCEAYQKQRMGTNEALDGSEEEGGVGYTFDVMLSHWDLAVVDWQRFMCGWGCWGNSDWIEEMARSVIEKWETKS